MFWLLIAPADGQVNRPKSDYTHIAVILDPIGSMESIHEDTIGGFNALLGEPRQQPA